MVRDGREDTTGENTGHNEGATRNEHLEVYGPDIVFAEHSAAVGTFPLAVREASVDALLAERVSTPVDDDAFEPEVARRAFEHFLRDASRRG